MDHDAVSLFPCGKYLYASVLLKEIDAYYIAAQRVDEEYKAIFKYSKLSGAPTRISSDPFDTHYVCDAQQKKIYKVMVDGKKFVVNGVNFKYDQTYVLSTSNETIGSICIVADYMFVKTQVASSDDTWCYLIDLNARQCTPFEDSIFSDAVHCPYLLKHDLSPYFLLEDLKFAPYELAEIRKKFDSTMSTNKILAIPMTKLYSCVTSGIPIEWKVYESAPSNTYITILQVDNDWVRILYVDEISHTSKIVVKTLGGELIKELIVPDVVTSFVYESDDIYVAWHKASAAIYDSSGRSIGEIPLNGLMDGGYEIQLNDIATVLDKRYAIFDATACNEEDSYQIRAIYDIEKQYFMYKHAAMIVWVDRPY